MNLYFLTVLGILVFLNILINILTAFTKSKARVSRWSFLVLLFSVSLILSWYMNDFATQWVLIEACTLFGALLISMSDNEKAITVAWKFLLVNSFGMGIAFLGLIFLSYSVHTIQSMNILDILARAREAHGPLLEISLWMIVLGYSVKLGLFPNQYWVVDTYSESPSQISALFASFIPVSIAFALRPVLEIDSIFETGHFSAKNLLIFMSIGTMLYSIVLIYHLKDIRKITSLVALFHNGFLGAILWVHPKEEIFYLSLAGILVVKPLIFGAMGILRLEVSSRNIDEFDYENGIHPLTKLFFFLAIFMAFSLPVSPLFLSDLLIIKEAISKNIYWFFVIPIFSVIFFGLLLSKTLPILNFENSSFRPEYKKFISIRILLASIMLILGLAVAQYSYYLLSKGLFL